MTVQNDTSVGATVARVTGDAGAHTPSIVGQLLRRPSIGMVVILLLLVAIFSALKPSAFLGAYNLRSIALAAAVVGVMAIGQTFVLATGGIDLSVGSVLVFGTVIAAKTMAAMGGANGGWGTVLVGTVVCILATAFWGLVNGLLVAVLRVPALIATLGTLGMALGAAQIVSNGLDIRAVPHVLSHDVGSENVAGVPVLVVIALVVAAISGLVMWQSGFGVHTKAIGSNPEGALRSGLAVRRHLVIIYTISGVLAGIAAMMSLAEFSTTTIGGHTSDNLATIAGAVLGGTSLFGGIATMFGTVIGILVPVTLAAGFVIVGVQPFWQTFAVGAVLVIAVYLDQLRRGTQNR